MDYDKAAIPGRFLGMSLDKLRREGYDVDEDGHPLDQIADWLTYPKDHIHEDGVGLLLMGTPGTGKTTTAAIVGMALVDQGYKVFYLTMQGYVRYLLNAIDLKAAWQRTGDIDAYADWKTLNERVLRIRNKYEVVILDDVGKEHPTASRFAEDEFDFLIRHRFDRALPTIMTSNVSPKEWAGKYSESMASFIREAFVVVSMTGTDRRKQHAGR